MNPRFARILVDGTTDREFDYTVPDPLADSVKIGSRVRLPFRNRQLLGTVIELTGSTSVRADKLRPISAVVGTDPAIPATLLELARWISDYYCAPLDQAMRGVLPDVIRKAEIDFKERQFARLVRAPDEDEAATLAKRSPRRAEVLAALETAPGQRVQVSQLLADLGTTRQTLQGLVKLGYVAIEHGTIPRDPYGAEAFLADTALMLNPEQSAALRAVRDMMKTPPGEQRPMLLHGVTGSGKTEVYLQAIALARASGRGALVLVPEISLTPQTVERFRSRFAGAGDEVAVLHSRLSEGERHDEWHRIHSGAARIVIGARSAIFAPVRDPGLIVVDEEHEGSYKQEEAPRYHARDIAVVRAKLEGCAVLLGSATPSLESFHNATTGKYELLNLTIRVDDRKMPIMRIIDMRREAQRQHLTGPAVLSEKLRAAVTSRLAKGEQTILFLNRRGFSSAMLCPKCGFVCECPNCSLALTFHRTEDQLMCHMCGHRQKAPKRCPNPDCRDPAIRHRGYGTERVEEVVAKVFPKARIARMDADTMTGKHSHRDALGAFKAGKTDILVGTQMIAKGLHFPNVTLVGIINADLSLHMNDFRAAERTFQLLTQVAGRAGRGDMEGEVIVQTCTPMSPAIQFARHYDFPGFWEQECEFRKTCDHPPFTHLILITVRSPHKERAEFTAQTLARRIREKLPGGAVMFDPLPAPWEKLKSYYRFQIQLRSRAIVKLSRYLRKVLDALPLPEDVQAQVDVDPQQLL